MKQIIFILLAVITFSSCSNYGKKVKSSNIEVYYQDGIAEEKAQQTADFIYSLDTNPETKENKKSFQLSENGDTINCKMVVNEDKFEDIPMSSFQQIGFLISKNVFDGKPVNLILSNNKFKPIKTVYFTKMDDAIDIPSYGEKINSGNIELYVTQDASMEDGEALAGLLDREMSPSNTISFQLTKNADGMNTVRMVSSPEKIAGLSDQTITEMAAKISDGVFNGNPIVFEFTDSKFETLKTFTYDPE